MSTGELKHNNLSPFRGALLPGSSVYTVSLACLRLPPMVVSACPQGPSTSLFEMSTPEAPSEAHLAPLVGQLTS